MNKINWLLVSGIAIVLALFFAYFIKINIDEGTNYVVEDTILGIVIFHNPFVLGIYIIIAVALIVSGLTKRKK